MRKNIKIFFLAAALLLPGPVRGQFLGYVSPQTVVQSLASNVSCTGSPQVFLVANLGQTQHNATVSGNNARQLTAQIEGVDGVGNVTRISDQLVNAQLAPTPTTITGNGYFPIVRVNVTCSGAGSNVSITYSGTSTPNPQPVGGYQISQVEKVAFLGLPANATQGLVFQPPFANSSGVVAFQYNTASVAGSFLNIVCTGIAMQTFSVSMPVANSTGLQIFQIPSSPCTALSLQYASGGATVGTITAEYIFYSAGVIPPILATVPGLQGATDGSSSFETTSQFTNPVSGLMLDGLTSAGSGSNRSLYFDRVSIVSSAAATVQVNIITSLGTTCGAGNSAVALRLGSTVSSQSVHITGGCAANPTVSSTIYLNVITSAGVPTILDLRGLVGPSGTTNGVDVVMGASLAGTISTTWYWYEKGS